jgi:hypothetical protein
VTAGPNGLQNLYSSVRFRSPPPNSAITYSQHLNAKLLEAQQTELRFRQERQALEAEKQAFELDVARRLDEERRLSREATRREDDEQHRFKLAEKDKVIDDMRKQVEELRRKSEHLQVSWRLGLSNSVPIRRAELKAPMRESWLLNT